LVFADHGNVEDQTPERRTSHTTNPVPFIVVSDDNYELRETGSLADIAPTVLRILGIEKPAEMTGKSLVK
jgi:2,3-bisphosphoglycerate-independent phosphoglycerate mutase